MIDHLRLYVPVYPIYAVERGKGSFYFDGDMGQDSSIIHPSIRKLLTRHFHFSNPYNDSKKNTLLCLSAGAR